MENFNSGKEKIDTALVRTLPEKQAIKAVPLTESKGAAQVRWMTPPRSNGALSVLNHPIAKADTAQKEPPSMPTIADHSPALQGIRHAFDRAGQTLYAAPVPNARRGRYQLTRPQHSKA